MVGVELYQVDPTSSRVVDARPSTLRRRGEAGRGDDFVEFSLRQDVRQQINPPKRGRITIGNQRASLAEGRY
jgi:hypothetical protein